MRILALVLMLALAPNVPAASPLSPPPPSESGGASEADKREALRETLIEYHVHLVSDGLELSPEAKDALAPKLSALFDASHGSHRERRILMRRLNAAVRDGAEAEAAGLVADLTSLDSEQAREQAELRESLLRELTVRQQAVYLAHEDAFRQRVLQRVRERRQGAANERGRVVPESMEPSRPMDRGAWSRPEGRERQSRARAERRKEASDELSTRLLLRIKRELEPDDETLCALIAPLQDFVDAQVEARSAKRRFRMELKQALESEAPPSEAQLATLVEETVTAQRTSSTEGLEARDEVLEQLDGLDAARFLVLSERLSSPEARGRAGSRQDRPRRRGGPQGGRRSGGRGR